MTRTDLLSTLAAVATLCLIAVSSYSPSYEMWGLNYLHYLGIGWAYTILLVFITVLVVGMVPMRFDFAGVVTERVAALVWGKSPVFRLCAALSAGFVFWSLRLKLFFVGDGYHLLNTFGGLSEYHTEVTKFGSVIVIRFVQSLLADVSYESATTAFQIVSVASGIAVVYNLIGIAGEIATETRYRFFCLFTLLFSGAMLLFFGHVEFYAMVWVAVTYFFKTSLRFLNHRVRLWPAVVSLAAAIALHMQAACFLPALAYLIWRRMYPKGKKYSPGVWLKPVVIVIPLLCMVAGLVIAFLPNVLSFFLPLFVMEASWAEYGVVSFHAALEVINLVFVVTPGVLLLIVLAGRKRSTRSKQNTRPFFALAAAGAAGFLLVINPSLGMARDFDLMSLMILPVALFLLNEIDDELPQVLSRPLVQLLIVSTFATSAFLTTNISVTPSEERIHDLLNLYGPRDRGGWISYTGYLKVEGRMNPYRRAMWEMDSHFPEHGRLREIDSLHNAGQGQEAERLSEELVKNFPKNGLFVRKHGELKARRGDHEGALDLFKRAADLRPDHVSHHLLGLQYLRLGRTAMAVAALERAHQLAPMDPEIIEGLASALLHLDRISQALSLADTLFILAPDSPGGHVIRMIGAIQQNDLKRAQDHYQIFLRTGKGRADYGHVEASYKFLIDSLEN